MSKSEEWPECLECGLPKSEWPEERSLISAGGWCIPSDLAHVVSGPRLTDGLCPSCAATLMASMETGIDVRAINPVRGGFKFHA